MCLPRTAWLFPNIDSIVHFLTRPFLYICASPTTYLLPSSFVDASLLPFLSFPLFYPYTPLGSCQVFLVFPILCICLAYHPTFFPPPFSSPSSVVSHCNGTSASAPFSFFFLPVVHALLFASYALPRHKRDPARCPTQTQIFHCITPIPLNPSSSLSRQRHRHLTPSFDCRYLLDIPSLTRSSSHHSPPHLFYILS